MKKIALIPARVESKRFYGKLLKKLSGVPIILRTYQSAIETNVFDDVFVVTHNDEIIDLMKSINGKYLKSASNHESGTDRIAEVAIDLQYDIIVNLQGDEPFIDKLSIEKIANGFNDKENYSYLSKLKPLNLYGKSKHFFDLYISKKISEIIREKTKNRFINNINYSISMF